jgi:hypothetical protein
LSAYIHPRHHHVGEDNDELTRVLGQLELSTETIMSASRRQETCERTASHVANEERLLLTLPCDIAGSSSLKLLFHPDMACLKLAVPTAVASIAPRTSDHPIAAPAATPENGASAFDARPHSKDADHK